MVLDASWLSWNLYYSIFVILPYGVLQQNISRPNALVKPLDNKYKIKTNEGGFINVTRTEEWIYYKEWNVVVNIFKSAYLHIFGELFIERFDPPECQSTLGYGSNRENLTYINFWSNYSHIFRVWYSAASYYTNRIRIVYATVMVVNHIVVDNTIDGKSRDVGDIFEMSVPIIRHQRLLTRSASDIRHQY